MESWFAALPNFPFSNHSFPHSCSTKDSNKTYTREFDAAVATLGGSAALLDVKNTELTTGSLDNPRPVGRGVVAAKRSSSQPNYSSPISRSTVGTRRIDSGQLTGSGDGR